MLANDDDVEEFEIDITQFMSFDLVRGTDSAPERKLGFTPSMDSFDDGVMKLSFDFQNPLYISNGETPDRIVA